VIADPRKDTSTTITLPDQNPQLLSQISLPIAPVSPTSGLPFFPYYPVPTLTSRLEAEVKANLPVNFELNYLPGTPDVEGAQRGDTAALSYSAPQVSPGCGHSYPLRSARTAARALQLAWPQLR
jgi:hypothetical protein